jgi:hypothetical protein
MYASIQIKKNESLSPVLRKDGGRIINLQRELTDMKQTVSPDRFRTIYDSSRGS